MPDISGTDTIRGRVMPPWRRILSVAGILVILVLAAIGVACASTAQRPGAASDTAAAGQHTPTRTPVAHSSTVVASAHPTVPVSGTPCPVVTAKPIAGCPICPDVHEAPPNGPLPCPPCPGAAQADPPCLVCPPEAPCPPPCPPQAADAPPVPCPTPRPLPSPTGVPLVPHPAISLCASAQTQGLVCGAGFPAGVAVSFTATIRSGAVTWQVTADSSGNVKTPLPSALCKLLPATLIATASDGSRSNALTLSPDSCLPTV